MAQQHHLLAPDELDDDELEAYMEERAAQKARNEARAAELIVCKGELEAERSLAKQALVALRVQIEEKTRACEQLLLKYQNAQVEQQALLKQALVHRQQEQYFALQLLSLEEAEAKLLCQEARAAATNAVRISGASGKKANAINGLYAMVLNEYSGGMPVYKKQGAEQWLEYVASSGRWISRHTVCKGQGNSYGHAYVACKIGVLPENTPAGDWYTYKSEDRTWEAQRNITIVSAKAAQMACAAARDAATYALRISGATGSNADAINGIYQVVADEVSGGMPVYKKQGAEQRLAYLDASGRWISKPSAKASDGHYTAYVACAIGVLPDKSPKGAWRVKRAAAAGIWTTQALLVVAPLSQADMAIMAADAAAAAAAVQAACAAAARLAPDSYAIRISGANGSNAVALNGMYEITDEVTGAYKKQQEAKPWLEYVVANGRWTTRPVIVGAASKGWNCVEEASDAYATTDEDDDDDDYSCALPSSAKASGWHVAVVTSSNINASCRRRLVAAAK